MSEFVDYPRRACQHVLMIAIRRRSFRPPHFISGSLCRTIVALHKSCIGWRWSRNCSPLLFIARRVYLLPLLLSRTSSPFAPARARRPTPMCLRCINASWALAPPGNVWRNTIACFTTHLLASARTHGPPQASERGRAAFQGLHGAAPGLAEG